MTQATTSEVAALDKELNDAIQNGQALEAFEKLYADDIVMQENSEEPTRGKDACRTREQEFFASVEEFHGAKVLARAVKGDVSFSEWIYEITFKGGQRVKLEQVAVRRWRNGQIARERFYYNKG